MSGNVTEDHQAYLVVLHFLKAVPSLLITQFEKARRETVHGHDNGICLRAPYSPGRSNASCSVDNVGPSAAAKYRLKP
ncbi:hypothetical protein SULPSESMR1_02831 [Pseudosulfitobacter pseudonitzschiae]|uniref:Uncharacterized protein n=1 Tax=Pseudosulfitobacter pseudonitzschiae TaxID=1402135 RepID=A0A221K3P4_9RHOB|nr:hypothetical protein SULPSESMR1_02831 [Pseudosulfitobacter pseudonitzschiae]